MLQLTGVVVMMVSAMGARVHKIMLVVMLLVLLVLLVVNLGAGLGTVRAYLIPTMKCYCLLKLINF